MFSCTRQQGGTGLFCHEKKGDHFKEAAHLEKEKKKTPPNICFWVRGAR